MAYERLRHVFEPFNQIYIILESAAQLPTATWLMPIKRAIGGYMPILPATTIADLYSSRWRVELFFDGISLCTPLYVIAFQGLADSNCLFAELLANGVFQGRHPHLPYAKSKAHYCTLALPANVLRVSFSVSSWELLPGLLRFRWWLIRRGFAFRLLGKQKFRDCVEPNIPV